MSEVKWFKIYVDMFDNKKIKQIEALPERDTIIVIWYKLLCLSASTNEYGLVYFTDDIPYTEEMLANAFNRPLSVVKLAMKTFEQFKMIEVKDELIKVKNWGKYQNVDGMEKIREQTRIRVNNYRERKKLECNVTGNATVTQCNDIDIDIDKEEDKELEKETKDNIDIHQKRASVDSLFNIFWDKYPRKVGKANCLKWFKSHKVDEILLNTMLKSIDEQKESKQWRNPEFIPHPQTWLNREGWNDKLAVDTFTSIDKTQVIFEEL